MHLLILTIYKLFDEKCLLFSNLLCKNKTNSFLCTNLTFHIRIYNCKDNNYKTDRIERKTKLEIFVFEVKAFSKHCLFRYKKLIITYKRKKSGNGKTAQTHKFIHFPQ